MKSETVTEIIGFSLMFDNLFFLKGKKQNQPTFKKKIEKASSSPLEGIIGECGSRTGPTFADDPFNEPHNYVVYMCQIYMFIFSFLSAGFENNFLNCYEFMQFL